MGWYVGMMRPVVAAHAQQNKPLFDHLVGAGEQRRRQRQAERFCRLQVDQELKSVG